LILPLGLATVTGEAMAAESTASISARGIIAGRSMIFSCFV
jgi:hypothetical protein